MCRSTLSSLILRTFSTGRSRAVVLLPSRDRVSEKFPPASTSGPGVTVAGIGVVHEMTRQGAELRRPPEVAQ